jgi:putative spermidine/putrescine transport system permease protein
MITGTSAVSLHDSTKEIGDIATLFLVNFSKTEVPVDTVMKDFTPTCPGTAGERQDVINNRNGFVITSWSVQPPQVTVGFGADKVPVDCGKGTWYDASHSWIAYGSRVARDVHAQWMLSAVSGIGMVRNWNSPGPVMPQVYDGVYMEYADTLTHWDFTRWTPDLVVIALGTTVVALSIGIPAAFGLVRRHFRGKGSLVAVFMSPIIVPYIITAIAIYFLFARLGLIGNPLGLLIAHTLLAVPKVVVIVAAALKGFDRTLERASMSLGAGPWVTFYRVTYPGIRPAVMAAALFSFLTSFDELILSMFITGPTAVTLPKLMWDAVRLEMDPTIAAASSLLIGIAVFLVGTMEVLRRQAAIRVPMS